jgi:hypothetical protein
VRLFSQGFRPDDGSKVHAGCAALSQVQASVEAVAANDPSCNYQVRKIYKSAPLINGRELIYASPDLHWRLNQLDELPRNFYVEWPQ